LAISESDAALSDFGDAGLLLRGQILATDVRSFQKGEVVAQLGDLTFVGGVGLGAWGAGSDGLEPGDSCVALQHGEAGTDLLDAIADGLELGSLVHDVDRRGDLTAVV